MNDYVRSTKPKYKFYKYDFFHSFKALFSPFFNYTKYKVLKKLSYKNIFNITLS